MTNAAWEDIPKGDVISEWPLIKPGHIFINIGLMRSLSDMLSSRDEYVGAKGGMSGLSYISRSNFGSFRLFAALCLSQMTAINY